MFGKAGFSKATSIISCFFASAHQLVKEKLLEYFEGMRLPICAIAYDRTTVILSLALAISL